MGQRNRRSYAHRGYPYGPGVHPRSHVIATGIGLVIILLFFIWWVAASAGAMSYGS